MKLQFALRPTHSESEAATREGEREKEREREQRFYNSLQQLNAKVSVCSSLLWRCNAGEGIGEGRKEGGKRRGKGWAKKCLEMRVGKSRTRSGGEEERRAEEEKFNLETQSSKLRTPKEVHAPLRASTGRQRGRFFTREEVQFHPVPSPFGAQPTLPPSC